jgi:hypothetical protein
VQHFGNIGQGRRQQSQRIEPFPAGEEFGAFGERSKGVQRQRINMLNQP